MKARTIGIGLWSGSIAVATAEIVAPAVWGHISAGGSQWWLLAMLAPLAIAFGGIVLMVWLDGRDQAAQWRTHEEEILDGVEAQLRREDAAWTDVELLWHGRTGPWAREAGLTGWAGPALTGREER